MCFGLGWHLEYTRHSWLKRRLKDSLEEEVAREDYRENWLYLASKLYCYSRDCFAGA